ncbi:MAG: hypothetical protein K2X82_27865 [Gemmataceae bacterium]|nr:hypothetical protein [Gemmataceae bacterium]
MSDDFDDDGFDPTEDTDEATVRRLEAEVLRLNAALDQLAAEFREQKAAQEGLRRRVGEIERRLDRMAARRRREWWVLPVVMTAWGAVGAVVASWLIG